MSLVIYPAVDEERLRQFRGAAAGLSVINANDEADAIDSAPAATAWFGRLTPAILAAAPSLRWVQAPTASLEHYLFPELIAHGCLLSNMRGIFHDVVPEHALALMLSLARNLSIYAVQQREARWAPLGGEAHSFASGPGVQTPGDRRHRVLAGGRLAIVGLGSIGRGVAKRAAAFEMEIRAIDPRTDERPSEVSQILPPEQLLDLLPWAEWWVLAAPHTPNTERLFGDAEFRAMRSGAILVNVGRGAVVDLPALEAALDREQLAGCGLDVTEEEPLRASSSLWLRPNVVITPHVAALAPHLAARHTALVVENIRRFYSGEQPRNLVDKSAWF